MSRPRQLGTRLRASPHHVQPDSTGPLAAATPAGDLNPIRLGRRSLLNAASSAASFLWPVLLLAVATPFILQRLGLERYGAWAFINALLAVTGAFSLGLGDGTVKLVAEAHARRHLTRLNQVLGVALTLYAILGVALGLALALVSPLLITRVVAVSEAFRGEVLVALWLAILTMIVTLAATPLARFATAVQRYEWAATIDIVYRSLAVIVQVVLLWLGYALVAIALAMLVLTVLRIAAQLTLARHLEPGLRPRPAEGREIVRRLWSFSFYGACIYVGGQAMQHLDRLLIGVLVGPATLTYYVVAQAVSSRIHLLLAHTSHFLFPLSSTLAAAGNRRQLARSFHLSTRMIAVLALALATPVILGAEPLLRLWLSADFARNAAVVLQWLTVGYALMSLNLSAYYLLQGTERPRINAVFALLAVVGVATVYVLAVPRWHLVGAASGIVFYHGASTLAQLAVVQRRILGRPLWGLARVLGGAAVGGLVTLLLAAYVGSLLSAPRLPILASAAGALTLAGVGAALVVDWLLWGKDALVWWCIRIAPTLRRRVSAATPVSQPATATVQAGSGTAAGPS
ncbi:MAG: hypothetical protein CL878_00490 [Dehalococcoidia bacterium]|nr:hypothetical protein [Dehalococcoidia bacterium]